MKHLSKILHVILLISLCANVYAHPADPTGLLAKYSMYAKDTIKMIPSNAKTPGDPSKEDNCWMGVSDTGFMILNEVLVNAKIKSAGTLLTVSNATNFMDTMWVNQPIIHDAYAKDNIYRPTYAPEYKHKTQSYLPYNEVAPDGSFIPTPNPGVTVPTWPSDYSVKISNNNIILNNGDTLQPGIYGTVRFNSAAIPNETAYFKKGVYEIKELRLDKDQVKIQIVKDSGEYCRIFVKDRLEMINKTSITIDSTRDKYGYVLLYLNDGDSDPRTNNYTFNNKVQIDATILAPYENLTFTSGTILNGQVLAHSIFTQTEFDGGLGEFYPFIKSNIEIVTDSVFEDPNYSQSNPDLTFTDNSGNRNISIRLKTKLDVPTTIAYQIVEITPSTSTTAEDGVDFTVVSEDTLRFDSTSLSPLNTPSVYIFDDDEHDNNETFLFRFIGESNPKDKIVFDNNADREKVIRIEDDDPDNTPPNNITLTPTSVKEEQPKNTVVGNIIITDKENNVNNAIVSNGAPFSVLIKKTTQSTTYELITEEVFDFEQGPRSYNVDITATDLGNDSTTKTFTIDILPINDSICKATNSSFTVKETEKIVGESLLPYLTDGDSIATENIFTYIPGQAPTNNFLHFELKSDGTFDYTPDPSLEIKKDSFSYTVKDQASYDMLTDHVSEVAWVYLDIEAVNDNKPEADTFNVELYEGEAVTVKNLFTDADSLDDSHTITTWGVSTAEESITVHSVDSITYLTSQDVTTEIFWDSVYYEVKDDSGQVDTGLIAITIKPLNDNTPIALRDSIEVTIGRSTTTDIMLLNDIDADKPDSATTLQMTASPIVSGSTINGGSAVANDRRKITLYYDPNLVVAETMDSIQYEIEDPTDYDPNNTVNNSTGWLIISVVLPDSTKPIANDDFITVPENGIATLLTSGESSVMTNDVISKTNSALDSVSLDRGPEHGTLALNKDGTFSYNHDDDKEEFFDSFTYTLFDKAGKESLPATVHITIDTINDNLPTIVNEFETCDEGQSFSVNITANDSDKDKATTLVVSIPTANGGAKDGTINLNGSILTYINNGTEGIVADTVVLRIQDSTSYTPDSIHTAFDTVFITINPVNNKDPEGSDKLFTLKEGETLVISDSSSGLLSDATDGDLLVGNILTATMITPPKYGGEDFDINTDGTFTYVHDDSENFFDSLLFEISDGLHKKRYTAKFTIDPVNDNKPIALNDTFPSIEGSTITPIVSILANDTDADFYLSGTQKVPGVLSVIPLLPNEPYHGIAQITADGHVTYTHDGSESTIDSMRYVLVDSNKGVILYDTATIIFTIPQTAPKVDSSFYYDEDGDGVVELVKVYFNDSLFLSETALSLTWDTGEELTILNKEQSSNGNEITLSLNSSPKLKTSGTLSLSITHSNMFDSETETVLVEDRAAPIISHGIYYLAKTADAKDSITVIYSEEIGNFTGAPYLYKDKITLGDYTISHQYKSVTSNSITYDVLDKSVKYVHNDDSIRVITANVVSDLKGNLQDSTIWAPIILSGKYNFGVELFIVPQPMMFEKIGKKTVAKEIDVRMLEYYNFPATADKRGVAFILTASLPLGAPELQEGYYTIYDAVGNMIAPRTPMSFDRDEQSRLNGLATWNASNIKDRSVGKSAYFCLVEVVLTTDEGTKMPPITIKRPIGVAE